VLGQLVKNVRIEGIDAFGVPFGRFPGGTLLVEKALPGDVVDVQALRLTRGEDALFHGRILDVIVPSPDRISPFCEHFMHCGGCQWQHTPYENQLRIKHDHVARLMGHHLTNGQAVPAVVPSPLQVHYRNKIVFTFSNRRWMTPEEKTNPDTIKRPAAGYLMKGKYDHTLEINDCRLAPESAVQLLKALRDAALAENIPFYDMRKERGVLRQLMVRYGDDGKIMAGLVFGEFDSRALDHFLKSITRHFPEVASICYFINPNKDGNLTCGVQPRFR
jgi:23S rRNA (uracil1939-C5)-methyltransferase